MKPRNPDQHYIGTNTLFSCCIMLSVLTYTITQTLGAELEVLTNPEMDFFEPDVHFFHGEAELAVIAVGAIMIAAAAIIVGKSISACMPSHVEEGYRPSVSRKEKETLPAIEDAIPRRVTL